MDRFFLLSQHAMHPPPSIPSPISCTRPHCLLLLLVPRPLLLVGVRAHFRHMDVLPLAVRVIRKLDPPGAQRKESVVAPDAHAVPGLEGEPALPHQDVPRQHRLPAKLLHPQALPRRVPPVLGGAARLLGGRPAEEAAEEGACLAVEWWWCVNVSWTGDRSAASMQRPTHPRPPLASPARPGQTRSLRLLVLLLLLRQLLRLLRTRPSFPAGAGSACPPAPPAWPLRVSCAVVAGSE